MRNFIPHSFLALSLCGFAAQLSAASLAVNNASFEADVLTCAPGCSTNDSITGWTGTVGEGTQFGVYKPSTASYAGGAPNGVNVAYLLEDGPSVSISQTLSATVQANDTYTLTVDEGLRSDTNVFNPGLGCYGATVALEAGGTVLSEGSGCPTSTGTFKPITVTYTAGANPATLGSPMQIVLTAVGSGSAYEPAEIDFDNVVLTDSLGNGNGGSAATPEPGSNLLVGGGLGLVGFLLRKRFRAAS